MSPKMYRRNWIINRILSELTVGSPSQINQAILSSNVAGGNVYSAIYNTARTLFINHVTFGNPNISSLKGGLNKNSAYSLMSNIYNHRTNDKVHVGERASDGKSLDISLRQLVSVANSQYAATHQATHTQQRTSFQGRRPHVQQQSNNYQNSNNHRIDTRLVKFSKIAPQMAPFMGVNELNTLKAQFANNYYPQAMVDKSINILKHLTDIGADYSVVKDPTTHRINVVLSDTHNTIRLFNSSYQEAVKNRSRSNQHGYYNRTSHYNVYKDINYTGSVFMPNGGALSYFYANGRNVLQNPNLLIDYAAGLTTADAQKQFSGNSNIVIRDPNTHRTVTAHFKPVRYVKTREALKADIKDNFDNSPKKYINELILRANQVHLENVLGDSQKGFNDNVYDDQAKLAKFMKQNGMTDSDKNATEQYAESSNDGQDIHINSKQQRLYQEAVNLTKQRIGNYQDGFDPNIVANANRQIGGDVINEMWTAMSMDNYDTSKLMTKRGDTGSLTRTRDHTIKFNPNDAHMLTPQSKPKGYMDRKKVQVLQYIAKSLHRAHIAQPVSIQMDSQGIVHWSGNRTLTHYDRNTHRTSGIPEPVQGEIGQIFVPDEHGILHTNFNSKKNFNIVPGKKAWFQYKGINENEPRMARLRISGFDQMLKARINENLNNQLLRTGLSSEHKHNREMAYRHPDQMTRVDLTSPRDDAILNGLYHSELVGQRLPNNWYENSMMNKRDKDARLATMQGRVTFGHRIGEMTQNFDRISNPRVRQEISKLVDGHKMSRLPSDYINVFDPNLTSGGKQQGLILYLDKGTSFQKQSDGTYSVIPVHGKELQQQAKKAGKNPKTYVAHTAIESLPYFKYMKYMPWDRKSVAPKYFLNEAYKVDPHTRAAYMTFGGDNFEDSTVVSKHFADTHKVPDLGTHNQRQYVDSQGNSLTQRQNGSWLNPKTGEILNANSSNVHLKMRSLRTGDKIDDFGHNKATIGQVVDGNMSPEEAKARHLSKEVAVFHQNPDLDVVMSPHSLITRGNGAVARAMMTDHAKNVEDVTYTDNQGKTHKLGESSYVPFMITKLTSDKQTTTYDSKNIRRGKERKFSSQMNWGAMAQDIKNPKTGKVIPVGRHIMKHVFKYNQRAWANYREYALATGLDIDRAGYPQKMDSNNISKYHPNEHRQVYAVSAKDKANYEKKHPEAHVIVPKNADDFLRQLGSHGGTLYLPFAVKMKSGVQTTQLPIMSAHLRSNVILQNGNPQINDYNRIYAVDHHLGQAGIFQQIEAYEKAEKNLPNAKKKYQQAVSYHNAFAKRHDGKIVKHLNSTINNASKDVQANVTRLGTEVENDELGGPSGSSLYNKHSYMRDHIMSRPVPHSATAVAQNDTRLPLDTIAVSPHIYQTLFGKKATKNFSGKGHIPKGMAVNPEFKNSYIWVHRDPVISPGSIRGFKVVEDKDMGEGFRMNPANAASFAGDFDGDTYGIINISSKNKGVQKDLKHMSVPYQLVDDSGKSKASFLDISTDMISGAVKAGIVKEPKTDKDPSTSDQLQDKFLKIADTQYDASGNKVIGKGSPDAGVTAKKHLQQSQALVDACLRNDFGAAHMNVRTPQAMKQSLADIIKSGAKGSPKNLQIYMDHFHGRARGTEYLENGLATEKEPAGKKPAVYGSTSKMRRKTMNAYLHKLQNISSKSALRHTIGEMLDKNTTVKDKSGEPIAPFYDQHGSRISWHQFTDSSPKQRAKYQPTIKANTAVTLYSTLVQNHGVKDLVGAFNQKSMLHSDEKMMDALSAKSYDTAAAGTVPQELMSAIGDKYPRLVLQMTDGATQANLSGKHHKDRIPKIRRLLHTDIPNLLQGLDVNAPSELVSKVKQDKVSDNDASELKKYQLSPEKWSKEFTKSYSDAGIKINRTKARQLANIMSGAEYDKNGHETRGAGDTVEPINFIKAQEGSAIMLDAYTGSGNIKGGYGALSKMAEDNPKAQHDTTYRKHSLAEGTIGNIAPQNTRYLEQHPDEMNDSKLKADDPFLQKDTTSLHQQAIEEAEAKANNINNRKQIAHDIDEHYGRKPQPAMAAEKADEETVKMAANDPSISDENKGRSQEDSQVSNTSSNSKEPLSSDKQRSTENDTKQGNWSVNDDSNLMQEIERESRQQPNSNELGDETMKELKQLDSQQNVNETPSLDISKEGRAQPNNDEPQSTDELDINRQAGHAQSHDPHHDAKQNSADDENVVGSKSFKQAIDKTGSSQRRKSAEAQRNDREAEQSSENEQAKIQERARERNIQKREHGGDGLQA